MANNEIDIANKAMQSIDDRIKNTMIKDLKAKEDIFAKSIIKGHADIRSKIPEDVFVGHFLKFFTGEETIKENPDIINKWIGVARTPMSEVDVTDNEGNTLFTVPPLFDTSIINISERSRSDSLMAVYGQYGMLSNNIQKQADDYIVDALDKKSNTILKESDKYAENTERWKTIFNRYGKSERWNEVSRDNKIQTEAKKELKDEVEYD